MDNGRVREWIGPRIVPVFADEVQWDIDSTYEPLIMVQSEGETFMSRQYVPAGVPLPNTAGDEESNDYWVHMSNWNAQVEYYRQEVLAFDNRIDALEDALPGSAFDSVNTVDSRLDALEGALPLSDFSSVNTVDARFDTIEANAWVTTDRVNDAAITKAKLTSSSVDSSKIENNTIKNEDLNVEVVNNFKSRQFILLGDSFGKGMYPSGGGYETSSDGWLTFCKSVIEGRTNDVVYTNVGYVQAGNHGFASSARFVDTLALIKPDIPDPNQITDIVVMSGTNDQSYTGNDLRTAITNFMNYCANNFPNAKVKIGCLGTNLSGLQYVAQDYMTCRAYGAEFMSDVYGLFCLTKYISSDGTHLTASGYNFYSRYLMQAVITGHCSYVFQEDITLDHTMVPTNYYIPSGNMLMRQVATENGVSLMLRPVSANVASLFGLSIRDTSNNTAAVDITITFNWKISLPSYYYLLTTEIFRKFNTTQIANTYDLFCSTRAGMYTTSTGLTIFTTATNGYIPFDGVEWQIYFGQYTMPWMRYQN